MAYSETYEYTTTVYSNNFINVRKVDIISKDGVEVGRGKSGFTIVPGGDTSELPAQIQAIATAVHTPAVVAAYKASQITVPAPEVSTGDIDLPEVNTGDVDLPEVGTADL